MDQKLYAIQRIAKILYVISKIAFVFCIIGLVASVISVTGLRYWGEIEVNGMDMLAYIEQSTGEAYTIQMCYAACGSAVVICLIGGILAYYTKRYLKNELEAGTPFTREGAKELRILAILNFVLPMVAYIAQVAIFTELQVTDIEFTLDVNLGYVLVMLILSLIFDYGADMREQLEKQKRN